MLIRCVEIGVRADAVDMISLLSVDVLSVAVLLWLDVWVVKTCTTNCYTYILSRGCTIDSLQDFL